MTALLPESGVLPPGYPREFERCLRLDDGRTVWVRPIRPADASEVAEAMAHADADTLHRRFLGPPPRLTTRLLTWLTTVDYLRRFALVAGDPSTGRGIAVARYETVGDGIAEVAVVVDPGWRRAGLATALLELLAEAALARGIHTFQAAFLAENRPVASLLQHAGGNARQMIKHGVAECAVALDRQPTAGGTGHA